MDRWRLRCTGRGGGYRQVRRKGRQSCGVRGGSSSCDESGGKGWRSEARLADFVWMMYLLDKPTKRKELRYKRRKIKYKKKKEN
jgi:hypothetical protein